MTGALGRATGVALGLGAMLGVPAVAAAHGLSPAYQSPLPLAVYLVGAAVTVALSFLFVLARDVRAPEIVDGRLVRVPAVLRLVLRAIGLIGWVWIVAQALAGGSSDAAVAPLFLWVFGWVGIAFCSALAVPGLGVARPVRDDPRHPRLGPAPRSASRAGA